MLVDYDITKRTVDIDGVKVTFSVLSIENYNSLTMILGLSNSNSDKYLDVMRKIVTDHVKKIEGAQVRENKQVRDAIADDLVKHSGFYTFTMKLLGKMLTESEVDEVSQKNLESPAGNTSQQD